MRQMPQASITVCFVALLMLLHSPNLENSYVRVCDNKGPSIKALFGLRLRGGEKRPFKEIDNSDANESEQDSVSFEPRKKPAFSAGAGIKLMEKMGYKGGGLGAKGQGIHEPLNVDGYTDREGLGKTEKVRKEPKRTEILFSDCSDDTDARMFGSGQFTAKRSREWDNRVRKALGQETRRSRKERSKIFDPDDDERVDEFVNSFDSKYGVQEDNNTAKQPRHVDSQSNRTDWRRFDRMTRDRAGLKGSGQAKMAVSSQERKKARKRLFDLRARHRTNMADTTGGSSSQPLSDSAFDSNPADEQRPPESQPEQSDFTISVADDGDDAACRTKQATRGEFFDPTVPYFQDTGDEVSGKRYSPQIHPSRRKPSVSESKTCFHDDRPQTPSRSSPRAAPNGVSGSAALRETHKRNNGQASAESSAHKETHRTEKPKAALAESRGAKFETYTSREHRQQGDSPPHPVVKAAGLAQGTTGAAETAGAVGAGRMAGTAKAELPGEAKLGLAARLQAQDAAVDADVRLIRTGSRPSSYTPGAVKPATAAAAVSASGVGAGAGRCGGNARALQHAGGGALAVREQLGGGALVQRHDRGENFRDDTKEVLDLLEEPTGGWRAPKGGWDRWTEGRVRATEALERRTGDAGFAQFMARAAQLAPPADGDGDVPDDGGAALPAHGGGGGGDGDGWIQVGPGGVIPADVPDGGGGGGVTDAAAGAEERGIFPHAGWRPKVGYQPVDTSAVDALRPAGQQELLKIMKRQERGRAARAARRDAAQGRERAERTAKDAAAPFSFTEFVRYQAAIKSYLKESKRRKAFAT